MAEKKPKSHDPERSRRFIKTARELDCDDDEAAFDEKLKRIAQVKPINRIATAKPAPAQREDING